MPENDHNALDAVLWNGERTPAKSWPALAGSDWLHFTPGFFETMRVADGDLPLWAGHLARMTEAARYWNAPLPNPGMLLNSLLNLAEGTGFGKMRLQFGYRSGSLDWLAEFTPGPMDVPGDLAGLKVAVYRADVKNAGPGSNLKSNHRDIYLKARNWMTGEGLDEAIVLNASGEICDATIANVWWVEAGNVFTPPLSSGPVAGVMRHALLQELSNKGWPVFEESADPARLAKADELFLTNALRGVMVVGEFEGQCKGREATDEITAIARGLLARPS